MSRRAQASIPLLGVLLIALSIPAVWRMFWPSAAQGGDNPPVPVAISAKQLDVMLRRAGLDPKVLAAAGVSTQSTTALVGAADTYAGLNVATLAAADTAYATSKREADALKRKIQSGKANEQEIASYPQKKAALETATAAHAGAVTAIFTAATAGLSNEQRERLAKIRANDHWRLPVEFSVVDRTEAEWVRLRDDLAHERFCADYQVEPDQTIVTRLATARANQAVAAAKTALDTSAANVNTSWTNALGD